jgi:L-asparaginase II
MTWGGMFVTEYRNGVGEAIHEVAVYSNQRGWLTATTWDLPMPTRSTAKPLLLALSFDFVGLPLTRFSVAQLAIMCSSHNGERRHRTLLLSLMAEHGVSVGDLRLGHHERIVPEDDRASLTQTPLEHNCSGKHVSSLIVSQYEDFEGDYLDPERPLFAHLQKRLSETLDREVTLLVDGCGYPTPALTAAELALLYAQPALLSQSLPRVLDAMLQAPWAVGGARRLSSELLARGIWAKEGFTGLFVVRLGEEVLVVKASSGSDAAVEAAVHALVQAELEHLPNRSEMSLVPDEYIRNDLGTIVGLQTVDSAAETFNGVAG